MLERGVLPDLLRPDALDAPTGKVFLVGARQIEGLLAKDGPDGADAWSVAAAPARWLPKLDAIALDCLSLESSSSLHPPPAAGCGWPRAIWAAWRRAFVLLREPGTAALQASSTRVREQVANAVRLAFRSRSG
jgi:hypothetical protein